MKDEFKQLNSQIEQMIPTSFTEKDRQAVRRKIRTLPYKRKKQYLIPKTLSILVFSCLIIIGILYMKEQLFPVEWNKQSAGPSNDSDRTEQINPYTKLMKEDNIFLTFDEKSITIGDTIGAFQVVDITHQEKETIISFEGQSMITGDIFTTQNNCWFTPNPKSLADFPLEEADFDKNLLFTFDDMKALQLTYNLPLEFTEAVQSIQDISVDIAAITYIITADQTTIELGITSRNQRTYETTIELSEKLLTIYDQYASSYNDSLLKGLLPFEVFQIYAHALSLEDEKVKYSLLIKGDAYGTPDEETYFHDPFWAPTPEMKENEQNFYKQLTTLDSFREIYLSNTEVLISFPSFGNLAQFRLIKDTAQDVWKIPLNAMQ
ncbi:hypothetical protein OEV98_08220 [Caldibacillus lycopersici]|uniref:DUF4179 domain-containing protein n=1 Tax=Perspicuibacillus lycopersici TaxID=1325689 RepID=A0AAE3LN67_9BACI|nr:hypothetical protein [Perspicuibacillus lycopersici]MCU9613542.1 hypothetical protein [Perspicuibacillus lycopersici]